MENLGLERAVLPYKRAAEAASASGLDINAGYDLDLERSITGLLNKAY